MSKLTVVLAALVACLGISALASASASAACVSGSWCVAGTALISGEMAELTEKAEVTESGVLSGIAGLEYKCTKLEGESVLLEGTATGMAKHLIFAGCSNGTGACQVVGTSVETNEITVSKVKAVGTTEVEATFEAPSGSFATIEVTGGSCSIAGKDAVKGHIRILGPTGQTPSIKQEIVANSGASELEILKKTVTLKGKAKLELKSGKAWSFG